MLNPFSRLYDDCNTGSNAGKYAALADFPKIIDVELTSACNFRCLFCPTGNLSLTRPAGFMSAQTMTNIIEQCASHSTAIRWIGWGEPLLHPDIVSFVAVASSYYGLLTHINTNGSKLTREKAEALVDAGLYSLKFSFQGVDRKSYAEARNIDFFDQLLETAAMVKKVRGNRPFPCLHISTSITYETPEQVAAFRERAAQLVDCVTVGRTTFDYLDLKAVRLKPAEVETLKRLMSLSTDERKHPEPCPEVFDKLSIHYDGSVRVCCNDVNGETLLGNVNETPIAEMWRHPAIEDYRRRLAANDYGGPLCSNCFDYASLTQGESPCPSSPT